MYEILGYTPEKLHHEYTRKCLRFIEMLNIKQHSHVEHKIKHALFSLELSLQTHVDNSSSFGAIVNIIKSEFDKFNKHTDSNIGTIKEMQHSIYNLNKLKDKEFVIRLKQSVIKSNKMLLHTTITTADIVSNAIETLLYLLAYNIYELIHENNQQTIKNSLMILAEYIAGVTPVGFATSAPSTIKNIFNELNKQHERASQASEFLNEIENFILNCHIYSVSSQYCSGLLKSFNKEEYTLDEAKKDVSNRFDKIMKHYSTENSYISN